MVANKWKDAKKMMFERPVVWLQVNETRNELHNELSFCGTQCQIRDRTG
jgi:hypothetical protein